MSMNIQSSVKDKILATSSETSKVENTPAEMLRDLDQQMEKRADDAKIKESSLIGPELVQATTNKVVLIKEKLKAARDRQKSCADNRRKPLEFEIKVDKTLRFIEEPVENSDRAVKRLKCSRMLVVKVHLGSKRGL
ncbi:hypothetical protein Tco_1505686 [Tanacetum coccineum]